MTKSLQRIAIPLLVYLLQLGIPTQAQAESAELGYDVENRGQVKSTINVKMNDDAAK